MTGDKSKETAAPRRRFNPYLIGMVVSGLLLAALLVVRLDLFNRPVVVAPTVAGPAGGSEAWMAIYQGQRKVGYTHRRLSPKDPGFAFKDTTFLRINTMGMAQDMHLSTLATLDADFSLKDFDFNLRSSLFTFRIQGQVEGTNLVLSMDDRRQTIALDTKIHLSGGLLDAVAHAPLQTGDSLRLFVFDPATLGQRPVLITLLGEEALEVMGQVQKTRKFAVDFMGQTQTAWVGSDGSVVQEQGLMGFTVKRVTQAEALGGTEASEDLTRLAAVPVSGTIAKPAELQRLVLAVGGLERAMGLDGGRQAFADGRLTITRETLGKAPAGADPQAGRFVGATAMIEADHPQIIALAGELAPVADPPMERVRKILAWVHHNIEKRPVLSVPSALATLKNRMGDCNEHAVLFAALARAAGLAAQVEAGLVYMDGRFYYHAWNVVHLDGWITVDALMNQLPADVTHIRLVRGEPAEQIDLMGVIGRLRLEVIEAG